MTILWNGGSRCNWFGRLSFLLISVWLITIILSVNRIFKQNFPNSIDLHENDSADEEKLLQVNDKIQLLKKQNAALRSYIFGHHSLKPIVANQIGASNDKLLKDSTEFGEIVNNELSVPSLQYEETSRKIKNGVQEFWYYISGELSKIKKNANKLDIKDEVDVAFENVNEHKRSLMINVNKLLEVDGYNKWREKESSDLANLVQSRFDYLQNPKNCDTAKKLICSLNKGCGFGCQLHHVVYCFLVAYGTERTLILKSKGWRYQKEGWESVFKPLSRTCTSVNGESHANWPGDSSKQVVSLPIVDNVYPKPIFQPPSVPADIARRLEKFHGYPLVWWIGQVLKFLMRPNDSTKNLLEKRTKLLDFKKPIVGVHIRRTDKVGTEAAFHDVDEYMIKVQHYFDNLEHKPKVKRVYLASDDPKVITTARKRYPDYEIIGDVGIAETASMSKRYTDLSLQGIIIDIHFLSLCDFLVCTFSSQVCRVAYELMQTYYIDAHDRFASLDDIYYYGGQNSHPQKAIMDHIPRRDGEIELKEGDSLEVYGNHWDGFSKGKNLKTGATGLFPSFKIINPVKAVEFPKYETINLQKS